jgi:hypothetical protein
MIIQYIYAGTVQTIIRMTQIHPLHVVDELYYPFIVCKDKQTFMKSDDMTLHTILL